ncbi:MAG: AarF/ABC1/UbiB kinase family protein [Anaerolineae bacterium]|nr:AarF/ABC1/UbiB kinase family protein [Anaerolineae bacterium]
MRPRLAWRPYQEIIRIREIGEILLKNGLGFVVERLELGRFLPGWRRRSAETDRRMARLSVPERVRRTLEELGPTYIKLGQLLSTRPDLLPPEYVQQLTLLLDAAPPIPAEELRQVLEAELGQRTEAVFAALDWEPIASASIGQVHRALLHNGQRVVVKVQRPGVERVIDADLDLLLRQLRFVESRSAFLREYRLSKVLEEFARALREELDYTIEGRNTDILRRNLAGEPQAWVPRVIWELTTRRVITMEDIGGIKLSELERLRAEGYDLPAVAELVVRLYMKQVFDDGCFHGDPHPANILVCGDRIGFVDFGMVGHLSDGTRSNLRDLLTAVVAQDADGMVRSIQRMGAIPPHADLPALGRDLERLLWRYYGLALEEVPIAQFLGDVFAAAFRNHILLPGELAVLARTVLLLEGVAQSLDPGFSLVEVARPFVARMVAERYSPAHLSRRGLRMLRQLEYLAEDVPPRVGTITEQLEKGQLTLGLDVRRLEHILARLDVVANRLAFSIVVAAMIVGSALVILGGERAAVFRLPLVGAALPIAHVGFIIAGLMATWLLLSIMRSRGV